MVRLEPVSHLLAQALGQRDHFTGFGLRRNSGPLVVANVSLLAEGLQLRVMLSEPLGLFTLSQPWTLVALKLVASGQEKALPFDP